MIRGRVLRLSREREEDATLNERERDLLKAIRRHALSRAALAEVT
jgi:hypothetical protein